MNDQPVSRFALLTAGGLSTRAIGMAVIRTGLPNRQAGPSSLVTVAGLLIFLPVAALVGSGQAV